MKIVYTDLDMTIKDVMRKELQKALVLKFKTLPLQGQGAMIKTVCTNVFMDKIKKMVIEYCLLETERDLQVDITADDMVKLYYREA